MEALGIKPGDGVALALQATASDNLKAARRRTDAEQKQAEAERKQAETDRQNAERLKQPRLVFAALCARSPDTVLFTEHELKTSKPAKDVEAAIVKSLQAAPEGFEISTNALVPPETYKVTGHQIFSLGLLGETERVCRLVVGQTKDDETLILFKVVEYKIQHTLVDLKDVRQLIPIHPSRMQMSDLDQMHVQTGIRIVTERIQKALQEVQ